MSFYMIKQYTLMEGSAALDGVPDNIDSLEWVQGKQMDDPRGGKELVLDLSLESGDYRGDIIEGFLTLFSDELKEALENYGIDNVQYYQVRLRDQNTGQTEGGYWIANIIGLIDCLDKGKSKITPSASGLGIKISSMVIDESKTQDTKIFRLKERPSRIIISEDLKEHLEKSDALYGVEVLKTEDFSDW